MLVSIVDLRAKVKDNADYEITADDLIEWERVNRRKLDPLVILWTGWASHWPDRSRYMGTKSDNEASDFHHFPGITFETNNSTKLLNKVAIGLFL